MAVDDIVTDPALKAALETSQQACDQAMELFDLISSSSASASNNELQLQISKQQKLLLTYLAQLRRLHREAHGSARETKAQTAEARQEVDKLHLQLQNLYYEQRHLQGEIAACDSFDHKYTKLPLVPLGQFLADRPDLADADEATVMKARIARELQERVVLDEQKTALLTRRQKLINDNDKRKEDLKKLDRDLEKFIDAAKPIQKIFEKAV